MKSSSEKQQKLTKKKPPGRASAAIMGKRAGLIRKLKRQHTGGIGRRNGVSKQKKIMREAVKQDFGNGAVPAGTWKKIKRQHKEAMSLAKAGAAEGTYEFESFLAICVQV